MEQNTILVSPNLISTNISRETSIKFSFCCRVFVFCVNDSLDRFSLPIDSQWMWIFLREKEKKSHMKESHSLCWQYSSGLWINLGQIEFNLFSVSVHLYYFNASSRGENHARKKRYLFKNFPLNDNFVFFRKLTVKLSHSLREWRPGGRKIRV